MCRNLLRQNVVKKMAEWILKQTLYRKWLFKKLLPIIRCINYYETIFIRCRRNLHRGWRNFREMFFELKSCQDNDIWYKDYVQVSRIVKAFLSSYLQQEVNPKQRICGTASVSMAKVKITISREFTPTQKEIFLEN